MTSTLIHDMTPGHAILPAKYEDCRSNGSLVIQYKALQRKDLPSVWLVQSKLFPFLDYGQYGRRPSLPNTILYIPLLLCYLFISPKSSYITNDSQLLSVRKNGMVTCRFGNISTGLGSISDSLGYSVFHINPNTFDKCYYMYLISGMKWVYMFRRLVYKSHTICTASSIA